MRQKNKNQTPKWGECYYDHFGRHLGKPLDRLVFERSRSMPTIQILSYANVFGGCRAFCSFGLSHYAREVSEVAEVFMPVDEAWEQTPKILAETLFYMMQHNMRIGRGTAVDFGDVFPDFVLRFHKSAIHITEPFGVPNEFPIVQCGKETGRVYLACYISEAEYHFKVENGTEKFESLLDEKEVDVFHIGRESCI